MSLHKGDLVLLPFPFTDLSATKVRPAIVLWTNQIDVTVCFVSSQNLDNISSEEFIIEENNPEFKQTGLKVQSKVIVSKLVTIQGNLITRRLGHLGVNYLAKLDQCLRNTFQL